MRISLEASRVELRAEQILRIDDALALRMVCERGTLWVTQDGDLRDLILGDGDSFTFDHSGVALVSALQATSVRFEEPAFEHSPGIDADRRR
jgi:hypothetical protein